MTVSTARQVSKKGFDLVPEADLARGADNRAHQIHYPPFILAGIRASEVSINSERVSGDGSSTPRRPINCMLPCFCVSIGVERGQGMNSEVYDPLRNERCCCRGQGATLKREPHKCLGFKDLNHAMPCTGFPYNARTPKFARDLTNFTMKAQAVRRDGSAAIDLATSLVGV